MGVPNVSCDGLPVARSHWELRHTGSVKCCRLRKKAKKCHVVDCDEARMDMRREARRLQSEINVVLSRSLFQRNQFSSFKCEGQGPGANPSCVAELTQNSKT